MSVNFEIITKDFENALTKYKVACQKDWQFVIRQQSRIVGEKLVKFTPPKLESHPNKSEMPIFRYKRIFKSPVRNIHKAAINKSGRVPKNWTTQYAVAGKRELKKYTRKVQLQVGVAKSGWLAALTKLGGKAQSFVTRHGTKYGGFVDGNKGDNPFFTLINNVSTFPQGGTPARILRRAFIAQTKAMENNIKRLMDKSGRIF